MTHAPENITQIALIAQAARSLWRGKGFDDTDFVLLLPHSNHSDPRLNALLCSAFNVKLGKRKGAIVEGEVAAALLALYSIYAFTDKLIIGSLDLPQGRKLRNLLDCGILTEDELINDVILGAMGGT